MCASHLRSGFLLSVVGLGIVAVCTVVGCTTVEAESADQPQAQAGPCDALIARLSAAISACHELNNNFACLGAVDTRATPGTLRFYEPEDRQPIEVLAAINTAAQPAGAALMRLQVLGESDPVTAILFGDVTLTPQGAQAFTMRMANGAPVCEATPPGLVVQTKSGQTGHVTVNNVDIVLRSTAYVTLLGEDKLIVVNLEGQVALRIDGLGVSVAIPVGQQVEVTERGGIPVAVTQPSSSVYFSSTVLGMLVSPQGLQQVIDPNTETVADIPACGQQIALSQTIIRENFASGQECLYKFCGTAGDRVTVAMYTLQGTLDPYLDLRAPDQTLLKWNDDIRPADTNSLICNRSLPVTSCDYTIVARSHRNDSFGSFRLVFLGDTACQPIEADCDVITHGGTNLREGPGLQYPALSALPFAAHLQPLGWNEDHSWVQVRTTDTSDRGWVSAQHTYCDVGSQQEIEDTTAPTESTGTAAPTGENGEEDDTPRKRSPFMDP